MGKVPVLLVKYIHLYKAMCQINTGFSGRSQWLLKFKIYFWTLVNVRPSKFFRLRKSILWHSSPYKYIAYYSDIHPELKISLFKAFIPPWSWEPYNKKFIVLLSCCPSSLLFWALRTYGETPALALSGIKFQLCWWVKYSLRHLGQSLLSMLKKMTNQILFLKI